MKFNIDLKEIYISISQHKLRNALTGFGIAWGIFILMIMMGFGESFQNGIFKIFSGYAENTIYIYGGQTSLNFKGESYGKQIQFDEESLQRIKQRFDEISNISPEASAPQSVKLTYDENYSQGSVKGVNAAYFAIKKLKMKDGRLFQKSDLEHDKPVCIISESLKDVLFKGKKQVIGEYINVGNSFFQVIGISKLGNMFDPSDRNTILIPYHYFQSLYNINTIDLFVVSLTKESDGKEFISSLKKYLASIYGYNPDDPKAIYSFNLSEEVSNFKSLFSGVQIFIYFVGFCILLTGIISVGNIMYVNINERTREIGIRKAIGATPGNILNMILIESIVLTTLAGLVGVIFGILVITLINIGMKSMADENSLFQSMGINWSILLISFVILIFSGVIAGILPAIKASKIKPVIALNQEN